MPVQKLVPVAAFLAMLLVAILHGGLHDEWGIDEAHKVADTYFFRLLVRGDFGNPGWTRHIVDRTNPAAGKFLFGLAATIARAPIPTSLAIRAELPDGTLVQRLRPPDERRFHDTLIACRMVSLLATALTAAILALTALRLHSLGAALAATALFASHYLVLTFATRAVYDPLLMLFVAATLPLVLGPLTPRRAIALALLCALAVGTRVSGAIAGTAVAGTLLIAAIRGRTARPLLQLAAIGAAAAVLTIVMNPFYWVPGPEPLPLRIAHRIATQFHDLNVLSAREAARQAPLRSLGGKAGFTAEVVLGDVAGLLILLGCALAIALAILRRRSQLVEPFVWSLIVAGGIVLWLPFPWPRYLLVIIPPLAMLAGIGYGELGRRTRGWREGARRRA
jgi:4-amino-4-deoxy-L-arabinose transferase-like glycosyltransferase